MSKALESSLKRKVDLAERDGLVRRKLSYGDPPTLQTSGCLVSPQITYEWGSGNFREIAAIRRRVYTTYYTLTEHVTLIKEILGYVPEEHTHRLLNEIENPLFNIDSKNYEQIKAYLWKRAKEEYPDEILAWEAKKDKIVVQQGAELLNVFIDKWLNKWLNSRTMLNRRETWRKSILIAAAAAIFEILEQKEPLTTYQAIFAMLQTEGQPEGMNVAIDFTEQLFSEVVVNPGRVTVLAGDINTIALDLKLYGETLIAVWLDFLKIETCKTDVNALLKEAKRRQWAVSFVVNEQFVPRNNNQVIQRNATRKTIEDLLTLPELAELKKFQEYGLFHVVSFSSDFPGTVLTDLSDEAVHTLLNTDKVIALGEQNNLTLDGLVVDSYRIAPIRDFAHIFYTGIPYAKDCFKYPFFSVLYVPSGILASINHFPDRETSLNAAQFAKIAQVLQRDTWNTLITQTRKAWNGNILEIGLQSGLLTSSEKEALKCIQDIGLEEKVQDAQRILSDFCGTYRRIETESDKYRSRVLHVIHFPEKIQNDKGQKMCLSVQFAQSMKDWRGRQRSKITFTDLLENDSSAVFAFNFLYFITRNLIHYFNQSNPHFNLGERFFGEFIGPLKLNLNGEDILYPPLYYKGAIGKKKDCSYVFGRLKVPSTGKVIIPIGDREKCLIWLQVNPKSIDSKDAITLFTPFNFSDQETHKRAPHSFGETRSMYFIPDNDRYNFVMINDKLLGVVRGRTEIPPFGTVLSVGADCFDNYEREILDREVNAITKEKKNVVDFVKVRFDFDLGSKWRDVEWLMGGALLMVDEGKVENLHYDSTQAMKSVFDIEGWNLESSQRTQETPVEADLNEARTTIGLTGDGQFFVSIIEGRANNRTGATHQETVDWLQDYFKAQGTYVRYALDLDSASSVALGYMRSGKFYLLSQTARGSDSKVGGTRYYNHLALLEVT